MITEMVSPFLFLSAFGSFVDDDDDDDEDDDDDGRNDDDDDDDEICSHTRDPD